MQEKLPKRSEVAKELTWRLEDIYADEALWEQDIPKALKMADEIASYAGKLAESAENLWKALSLYEEMTELIRSCWAPTRS